jgi:hypothetical protein
MKQRIEGFSDASVSTAGELAPADLEVGVVQAAEAVLADSESTLLETVNNAELSPQGIKDAEDKIGRYRVERDLQRLWAGAVGRSAAAALGSLVDYQGYNTGKGMSVSFSTQEAEGIVWHHVGGLINDTEKGRQVGSYLSEPVKSLIGKTACYQDLLDQQHGGVGLGRTDRAAAMAALGLSPWGIKPAAA